MYGRWTIDDKRIMVDDYRRTQRARCPNDYAILTVSHAGTGHTCTEAGHPVLQLTCPSCCGSFRSSEIESRTGYAEF